VRFPTLEEVIACNEAVRGPDEVSPGADDDDLELVRRTLQRVQSEPDPVDAAAALLYEIVATQAFFEGNKRTAVIIARWFIRQNTNIDPDELIQPDDRELGALLVRTARGDRNETAIRALLRERTAAAPG
jgi:prophage maintenance system killer protein